MSEAEFVAWCGPFTRAEWVDGEIIIMAPASFDHVDLNDWLVTIIRMVIEHHRLGVVLSREFFIRLPKQRRRRLPDLLFISTSRTGLLHEQYFDGAPDLLIEVVSPDSEARDWRDKYLEYEKAGVREYWVIDPMSHRVEAYVLVKGRYTPIEEDQGKLSSTAIPGFWLKTDWLWRRPLPPVRRVLRELGVR